MTFTVYENDKAIKKVTLNSLTEMFSYMRDLESSYDELVRISVTEGGLINGSFEGEINIEK